MTDNLKLITEEYENLKGQHVISSDKVYRLIGIGDDGDDWYYALYDGREVTLASCVGSVVPLKGYILDKHYNEMIRIAKMNDFDQPGLWMNKNPEEMKVFNEEHKKEVTSWSCTKLILGPCWDLI